MPALPAFSFAKMQAVLPDAIAFALLSAIESLLSAVVADGMTGRRNRSNCELVAQGVANIGSALFGGICVTGLIARTATNIRAGARGPVAGMLHSVFVLLFIACVNVSGLLLARAVKREHEFIVRASIGASRMRLVRHALTESLLLAFAALPVAIGFAFLALKAILRIVPRVERQEFINAGVVVLCLEKRYLDARIHFDPQRLNALWPDADAEIVRQHLEAVPRICAGDSSAGPIALLSQRERFHWLTAPRSTIIQPSPVHTGVCDETGGLLDRLSRQFLLP